MVMDFYVYGMVHVVKDLHACETAMWPWTSMPVEGSTWPRTSLPVEGSMWPRTEDALTHENGF